MADAGKYKIAANKVGVQASHVMYQIVNITGGDFQDDIRKKYGQKGAFIAKTMDLLEGVYKDKSGESHEELFDKLLQMYEIDKDSNAYDAVGRVNYKEALRLISKQACLITSKITSTKNESRIGNIGRNLALTAGTIGGMMGIGGPAQAQTPRPQPSLTASEKAELKSKDTLQAQAKGDSAALSNDGRYALKIKAKAEIMHSSLKSFIFRLPAVEYSERENNTFIVGLGDGENDKLVLLEHTMTTLRKIAASKSYKEQEAMISELSQKLNLAEADNEEMLLNLISQPQLALEKIRKAALVLIGELQKQNTNMKR
jgi:hypothetical protein